MKKLILLCAGVAVLFFFACELDSGAQYPSAAMTAAGISFTDSDPDGGECGGDIIVFSPKDETGVTEYTLYWGVSTTEKQSDTPVASIVADGSEYYTEAIDSGTAIPPGAMYFLVFAGKDGKESSDCQAVSIMDLHGTAPGVTAEGIAFTDNDPEKHEIGGDISVERAADESEVITYACYWSRPLSDGTIVKVGLPFFVQLKTEPEILFTLPENSAAPAGITHVSVYVQNTAGEAPDGVSTELVDRYRQLQVTVHDIVAESNQEHKSGVVAVKLNQDVGYRTVCTVKNIGIGDLKINSFHFTGNADYSLEDIAVQSPFTLWDGESQDIVLRFHPQTLGVKETAMSFKSNDSDHNGETFLMDFVGKGISNIAAHFSLPYSYIVKADGTLCLFDYMQGLDRQYEPTNITLPVVAVTAPENGAHALALTNDGQVYSWGVLNPSHGELGRAGTDKPALIPGIDHVTAVAASFWSSTAITADDTYWIWGMADYVFADSGNVNYFVPTAIDTVDCTGKLDIDQYGGKYFIQDTSRNLYSWGDSANPFLLGRGTEPDQGTPQFLAGDVADFDISQAAGAYVTTSGALYVWGCQTGNKQLGPVTTEKVGSMNADFVLLPQRICESETIADITMTTFNGFALTEDGKVLAWGNDEYEQLGNGHVPSEPDVVSTPAYVQNLSDVLTLGQGRYCGVVVKEDGSLWYWGDFNNQYALPVEHAGFTVF